MAQQEDKSTVSTVVAVATTVVVAAVAYAVGAASCDSTVIVIGD